MPDLCLHGPSNLLLVPPICQAQGVLVNEVSLLGVHDTEGQRLVLGSLYTPNVKYHPISDFLYSERQNSINE